MKKYWITGLLIAAMALPSALFAQVETSVGTLQIGGKIKWLYIYQAEEGRSKGAAAGQRWGFDGAGREQFTTSNVELDVNGTVGENVAYIIELQASLYGSPGNNTVGMTGTSSQGELNGSAIGVRQAKIIISDLIPMTTVTLGTFNLPVGTYQGRSTNDWDLINLPLMNLAKYGNPGPLATGGQAYAPIGLGWQATGVLAEIKPVDMIALNVAYFNGYENFGATNVDADLEKSWLVGLKLMPTEGAVLGVTWLSEGWQEDINNVPGGSEQQNADGWVINGGYETDQFEINADWMSMTAREYARNKRFRTDDLNWQAWQITAGVWVTDSIELLARYDWVDPDTKNAKRALAPAGPYTTLPKYDAVTMYTAGANIRLSENAEVSANYIWVQEQGTRIYQSRPAQAAGAHKGKRQALDNNQFLIQVQVWQ